jgi:pimeloyl-ACP methyl ester carboxylesterase
MKALFFAISFVFAFIAGASEAQADFKGFIEIERGRELFVDFTSPERGQPIVVIANGLTQDTRYFEDFAKGLHKQGFGVLRWDMMGQLASLKRYGKVKGEIHYLEQIKDLRKLLVRMDLRRPMNFVGLSYGAMIVSMYTAMYPEHVLNCVAMAPFTAPIAEQDHWIKMQIKLVRINYPMNPATDDELYAYFLKQIVYSTYPSAEPSVFDHPYKLHATLWMAFGVRKYLWTDIVDRIPQGKFHMVIAGSDEYLKKDVTDAAWNALPRRARESRVVFEDTKHKINEQVPYFSSAVVGEILRGNPVFSGGRTVFADRHHGTVHDGNKVLISNLPRE